MTATPTSTSTPVNTPTATGTITKSATPTGTNTPVATATRTATPTRTDTRTATPTVTETAPASPTATATPLCASNVVITNGRLDVAHDLNPSGDELFKARGEMTLTQLSPIIDLSLHGFTINVLDTNTGASLFSRFVPPGLTPGGTAPGWHIGGSGWKYNDKAGTAPTASPR